MSNLGKITLTSTNIRDSAEAHRLRTLQDGIRGEIAALTKEGETREGFDRWRAEQTPENIDQIDELLAEGNFIYNPETVYDFEMGAFGVGSGTVARRGGFSPITVTAEEREAAALRRYNSRIDERRSALAETRNEARLGTNSVVFDITPEISESASASFEELSQMRSPSGILIYQGSPGRTYSISGKLFSRTQQEASRTYRDLYLLRSWRKPEQIGDADFGINAPSVIKMSGYNGVFRNIPVVMTSLGFEWSSDTDYVTAGNGANLPILLNFSISLKEAQAVEDFKGVNTFDITRFREGVLDGW